MNLEHVDNVRSQELDLPVGTILGRIWWWGGANFFFSDCQLSQNKTLVRPLYRGKKRPFSMKMPSSGREVRVPVPGPPKTANGGRARPYERFCLISRKSISARGAGNVWKNALQPVRVGRFNLPAHVQSIEYAERADQPRQCCETHDKQLRLS